MNLFSPLKEAAGIEAPLGARRASRQDEDVSVLGLPRRSST